MAVYALVLSAAYALLALAAPATASALVVGFISAIVIPACWEMVRDHNRKGRT
jgi:RsiW-degrading membrane proteinase PrsW (M82 family)